MLNCSIERQGYAFMIRANEQLIPPYAYMTYQAAKGRYADFRSVGVRLVSVAVYAGDRGINPTTGIRPFRPGFMKAPGVYDFSSVEEDFRRAVCGASPGEAFLLPRLMLEMPLWWEEMYPQERCLDAAGTPSHTSFSSERWLSAAIEAMEHFNAWLTESGWNEYIVGWHIAAGSTEEYIRPVLHPLQFLDYSQPSLSAYRRWLQNKYSSVQVLNTSWKSEYVDFTDIPMPSPAERAYPMCGSLRDPDKEKHVLDFYEFYGDELAFFVRRLCMEGKRITDGKKLMGVFYGSISICTTELSHNSMNLLLQCDEIDFFASPFCYTDNRGPAHDWPFQATLESAHLHGKPWFVEADVRTFLSRPISQCMPYANPEVNKAYDGPVWLGPDTVEGSLGDMLKAFSRILTHNAALWWFDMWGGWYDHEALMDFHRWAYPFYENIVHNGGATPRAQLAVFIDEKALSGFSPRDSMAHAVCYQQIVELGWLGAPYDCYLLSDFEAVDPTRYRMAMLLSPAGLTEGQRKHLAYWKKDGRTVLFTGFTSYFFGHMGEETDIAYEMSDSIVVLRANYGSEVYPEGTVSGPAIRLHPDAGDVPLSFDETGNPVAVLHRSSDYQTVWSIVPQVPCSMVRDMMLLSGAHIYCHSRDNVYAGGDLVIIHACSKGVKRIFLPSIGKAYDVFTGERLPGTELWVEIEMQVGQTCMLRLELTPNK